MRTRLGRGCAILLALFAVSPLRASEGFEDLVNQVRSGADDAALTAYIAATPLAYDLTVDEILYLNDLGVSAEMIEAAVAHGKKLSAGAPAGVPAVPVPTETPVPPPPIVETPPAPVVSAEPMPVVPETPPLEVPPPLVDLSGGTATVPPAAMVVQEPVVTAPTVAAPPPGMTDVSYFYQTLAPYGSWLNLDDGWYWQPTVMVVNREWRPYCERGHWMYTDCGWLWQSDYSWGWAPFHYGRWRQHARYGWVWMPDTVWGPAWVVWRGADAAVGWAPLPPGAVFERGGGFSFRGQRAQAGFAFGLNADAFTFVESANFCESALSRHRLQRAEQTRVYNTTTIIQNSYTMTDNRIFNHGPPVGRIAGATHREIKPLRIHDQPLPSRHPPRPGTDANQTIGVFRPHVEPTAHETPEAVAARARALAAAHRAAEPRHGWGGPGRPAVGPPKPALPDYGNGATVRTFSERGGASRGTAGVPIKRPAAPFVPGGDADAERNRAELQRRADIAARQRQAEEALAAQRQKEEAATRQQQQQLQEAQRRAQETARQQDIKRRAQDAQMQQDAQHQAQETARQQDIKLRAQDAQIQQNTQRQAQETARQQDIKRRAQDAQLQQDAQRRLLQSQRQAEEASARQQEAAARQQDAQRRNQDAARQDAQRRVTDASRAQAQKPAQTPPGVIQDYGNSKLTGAASARGAASRDQVKYGGGK